MYTFIINQYMKGLYAKINIKKDERTIETNVEVFPVVHQTWKKWKALSLQCKIYS